MSKKSYKRNQNRLYREIKRRILAEQMLVKPMKFSTCERKIETLKIRNIVPNFYAEHIEIVKQDMANKIVNKLIAEGFIEFRNRDSSDAYPIKDITEIEAILNVVKPIEF